MRSMKIDNEFVNGEVELGKRYKISDYFQEDLDGIVVGISNYCVFTDGEPSVEDETNITVRKPESFDDVTILVEDIVKLELIQ